MFARYPFTLSLSISKVLEPSSHCGHHSQKECEQYLVFPLVIRILIMVLLIEVTRCWWWWFNMAVIMTMLVTIEMMAWCWFNMAMMLMVMIKVNGSSTESLPAIMEDNKVGHHCNVMHWRKDFLKQCTVYLQSDWFHQSKMSHHWVMCQGYLGWRACSGYWWRLLCLGFRWLALSRS